MQEEAKSNQKLEKYAKACEEASQFALDLIKAGDNWGQQGQKLDRSKGIGAQRYNKRLEKEIDAGSNPQLAWLETNMAYIQKFSLGNCG